MNLDDSKYCTYLTIYKGNKLPPFYIGSTSINKLNKKNYHGSVKSKKYEKLWNSELKENPQLFKTKIITTHLTRKDAYTKELFFQEALRVIESSLYINMSYARKNGGFGDHTEESKLKISLAKKGIPFTEEAKRNMSLGRIGKKHTEETKQKMSSSHKNRDCGNPMQGKKHTEETKQKMSNARKLYHEKIRELESTKLLITETGSLI